MVEFTDEQLAQLRANKGKACPTCNSLIGINKYGISSTMVTVLRQMAKRTAIQVEGGYGREIDVEILDLLHSQRTQLTKMRFHGLVTKVKNTDGSHKARHWLVTHKGFKFLNGEPIPKQVEVYKNTVLGHDGGTITIEEVERADKLATDPENISREAETPQQGAVLSNARVGLKNYTVRARYVGRDYMALHNGDTYDLEIERLQAGKPVIVVKPMLLRYADIAAFNKAWKAV